MIIDAHTVWHTYEKQRIRFSAKEFIAALNRFEIERAMVCAPFYLRSDYILGNDRILELMDRYPEKVIGFCSLNPLFEEEAISELERCLKKGMKGIKLHSDISKIPYDDPRTFPIVEKAIDMDIPLFLHTGEDSIEQAKFISCKFPEATFIFAHIGNKAWRKTISFAKDHQNIILCTSGLIFDRGFLEESVSAVGDERVVYGSDFVLVNPAINIGIVKNFPCPNAVSATNSHFNISLNENYGEKEVEGIFNALKKVEQAYKK